jgi:hypothetical protein
MMAFFLDRRMLETGYESAEYRHQGLPFASISIPFGQKIETADRMATCSQIPQKFPRSISSRFLSLRREAHDSADHKRESDKWRKYTIRTAIALGLYAVVTMFLHKIPGLMPDSTYDSIQLAVSKVLIFAVLGYMVLLCARNFLSHKHNEIVNKHRQNALLTFKALVDAGGKAENRDVVLTYAAACIFSPQDTGYSRSAESGKGETLNIVQALPKLVGGKSE